MDQPAVADLTDPAFWSDPYPVLAEEPAWVPYASIRRFEQLIVTTA